MKSVLIVIGAVAVGGSTAARGASATWWPDCQTHSMYPIYPIYEAGARPVVESGPENDPRPEEGCGFPAGSETPLVLFPSQPDQGDAIEFFKYEPLSWSVLDDIPLLRVSVHPEAKVVRVDMESTRTGAEGGAMVVAGTMIGYHGVLGPVGAGHWEFRQGPDLVGSFTVVPEPGGALAAGLAGWAVIGRRRSRRSVGRGG